MFFRSVVVFVRYASIPIIGMLLRSFTCDEDLAPLRLYHTASSLGLCPKPALAKLPSWLFAPDFKAVLVPTSSELPSTAVMSGQRLDLGKIMAALESTGTEESTRRLEAVRRFDDQVKLTIRSIGKLNWASQLTLDTCAYILSGLVDTLEGTSGKPISLQHGVVPLQEQINAWVEGLLDQLRSFYQQTTVTLNDLDSSESRFLHIFQIPATTMIDRETHLVQDTEENNGWTLTADILGIDSQQLRIPVIGKAIEDFEALVKAMMKARTVVAELSNTLSGTIREIEAAFVDPDKRVVVRMDSQKQVDIMVEKLSKLKQDIQQASNGQ